MAGCQEDETIGSSMNIIPSAKVIFSNSQIEVFCGA